MLLVLITACLTRICPSQTVLKVSRCEHTILDQAREVIQKELEEETKERLRKIKKSVLEPVQGAGSFFPTGNLDLRKKYASLPAAEVVLAVFSNAEGVFSPRMTKVGARHIQMHSMNIKKACSVTVWGICFHSFGV